MYKITVPPDLVHETLAKHILADGLDLTFDLEKSSGVIVYDSKHHRELLDFFTCFASVPLGYNHPKMVNDEVFMQNLLFAALTNPSNSDIYTTQYAQFLKTFSRIAMPDYMHHVFFISGGGLAIENALKTAMDWKVQKNFAKGYRTEKGLKVLHFEHAFHGRTGYTMSLTNTNPDKTKWYAKFDWPRVSTPLINFPFKDEQLPELIKKEALAVEQIRKAFEVNKDDICAIIIEPVQAEGGDNHIRKEFMEKLRALADEYEAMLIYDEIQTGVALTGKFWCHEHFGPQAQPDILVFGKKMQVCGIMVNSRVDEVEENVFKAHSRINSTWGGSLADMVRATQILEIIEEDNLCLHAAETGAYLLESLAYISSKFKLVSKVRGKGLLAAFDLPDARTRDLFIQKALQNNVLFLGCGESSVRFRPALVMQKEHIDKGMQTIEKTLMHL